MSSAKNSAIQSEIDELYGKMYMLNDLLLQRSEKTIGEGEIYSAVDIFDFYPFDLKTAGGTELVTRVNGEKAAFNAPLAAGDKIELYWR